MGVNAGVTGGTSQVLILSVGNVLVQTTITILLGQTKVNHVHEVSLLAETHQEIVGLDVAVNEVTRVDVFDATDLRGRGYGGHGWLWGVGIFSGLLCEIDVRLMV